MRQGRRFVEILAKHHAGKHCHVCYLRPFWALSCSRTEHNMPSRKIRPQTSSRCNSNGTAPAKTSSPTEKAASKSEIMGCREDVSCIRKCTDCTYYAMTQSPPGGWEATWNPSACEHSPPCAAGELPNHSGLISQSRWSPPTHGQSQSGQLPSTFQACRRGPNVLW